MGSSLGGVVSFFLAWQWDTVFGKAACLSSTFGHQDDLEQRVAAEAKKDARFYIDSAWKRDNYEVTRSMCNLLAGKGYKFGEDLLYFSFPNDVHNEQSWSLRCHLPFQFFFGKSVKVAPNL
jgi:predicted alpha/beta superfamily hydrolase